jgi:hypothetical protein
MCFYQLSERMVMISDESVSLIVMWKHAETSMHQGSKKKKKKKDGALISITTLYLVSSKDVTPSDTRPDYRPSASSILT